MKMLRVVIVPLVLLAFSGSPDNANAVTVSPLWLFTGVPDGSVPEAGLILGTDGFFYGTTAFGGTNGFGAVFRISSAGVHTNLHLFTGQADGVFPEAPLIQASDGNFYGTTQLGGASDAGVVFKITPAGTLTTLWQFTGGGDGSEPIAALVQGIDGNFYGTASQGGTHLAGTVFQITPAGVFTNLHNFTGGTDGGNPGAGLIQGLDGNFYGTTSTGGSGGFGTIFRITPTGILTNLYGFTGGAGDGGDPEAGLIQVNSTNFLGTTNLGGTNGFGTVFQLTLTGTGSNLVTILHSFTGGVDGANPMAGLMLASDGSFYGTASSGGNGGINGTIFRIDSSGGFTKRYAFTGLSDGAVPLGGLVQAGDGSFYGTASSGGNGGINGNVFRLVLPTYVSASNTNDPLANGTLTHPFPHIQDGLNAVANLDIVQVLNGVYSGTGNTNLDFLGKSVTLQSVNGPANAIIDCQNAGGGFWFHNGEGNSSVIAGFTVTRAASNIPAIYLQSGSPTITNCVFQGNGGEVLTGNSNVFSAIAVPVGGCVFVQNTGVVVDVGSGEMDFQNSLFVSNQTTCVRAVASDSSVTINNCVFQFNHGTVITDGEFFDQTWISIVDSLIQSNAGTACSLQNGAIRDSTIEYNQGDGYDEVSGGFDNSGSLSMSGVVIQNNGGAGLNAAGDASVDECTFSANGGIGLLAAPRTGLGPHGEPPQSGAFSYCLVTDNGGGMGGNSQCTFDSCVSSFNGMGGIVSCGGDYVNCLLQNNLGPAVALNCSGGSAVLNNCSAVDNPGLASLGNGNSATLYNSISWGNGTNPLGTSANGSFVASYSDIQFGTGQPWFGTGCIEADPLFVSGTDFHLTVSSPCIAAGISSNSPALDLEGEPRGNPPDMGCYEVSKIDSDRDGIPDWWMLRYFGHPTGLTNDNSLANDDADGTGQNNLFKYTAGLDPTNPASIFVAQVTAVTNQTAQYKLMFGPWATRRTYSPQFSTDLVEGVWLPLPGYIGPVTNGNQIVITDTNAIGSQRFYRVDITYTTQANATIAPSIPSVAMATATSISQVTVTWAASTDFSGFGLAGYQIYRDGVLIATTTDTSFSESGLSSNTQYCYTIVAYDNAGNVSSASSQICVTTLSPSPTDPAPPSNLRATVVTSTSISLQWQDNSNNELGFQILRATSPAGPWSVIGETGANVTSFTDTGLNPSTTYYYEVAAFN